MRTVIGVTALVACLSISGGADQSARTGEWARFRGPNGSGVSTASNVPIEFSPTKNLQWRLPLPAGHSSPILLGDRIYLTAYRGDALLTMAIDRRAGKILWEREAPGVKTKIIDKRNNPASPSPAVEANGIYVFFPDYGMVAYDASGKERWKMPLGPFNNIYGMGASPVIVGDLVVLACDQSTESFLLAVDKRTGQQKWKTMRPEAKSGHSTPILWRAPDGRDEILLPGSFLMIAYDAQTGAKRWWVRGLSFEMKSTPVIGDGVLFINGYRLGPERTGPQDRRAARRGSLENGRCEQGWRAAEGRISRSSPAEAGSASRTSIQTARSRPRSGSTTARPSIPKTACWRFASAAKAT